MINTVEKKNIELGAGGSAEKKIDYKKILEGNNQEGGDEEARIAQERADELLRQIESEKTKKDIPETGETKPTSPWKDGEERKQSNPGEYNEQRVNVANNFIQDVQKTDPNSVANRAQRMLKKLNIFG